MLNNYYTLLHLSKEFSDSLSGTKILQASTRLKNTLEILFDAGKGQHAELVVSCLPHRNFVYLEARAGVKLKGAHVFQDIVGKSVRGAAVIANERQVYIEFGDDRFLRINLFGPAANVYYTDSSGSILDSFLRPAMKIGKILSFRPNPVDFPLDADELQKRFSNEDGDFVRRLSKCAPTIDGTLAREISYRYRAAIRKTLPVGSEERSGDSCKAVDFRLLQRTLYEIKAELLATSPRIYFSDEKPLAFGLIKLEHLNATEFEEFESVNEGVRSFITASDKSRNLSDTRNEILKGISREIDSTHRTLEKIEADIKSNRSGKYMKIGEYIMSHLYSIRRGATSIRVENGDMEINLDPSLSPAQNAQAYFDRAKQARMSVQQAVKRKAELEAKLQKAEELFGRTETRNDSGLFLLLKEEKSEAEERRSGFREFEYKGYKIYVGKDARNNDALTFGFAKPNDVFLHARGVSGSHVVIRNFKREYPPKPVLQIAAGIAGHYSKARTSQIIPVTYTMRKFVKKAKGKPGAVIVDREEVIFVKPGLPK